MGVEFYTNRRIILYSPKKEAPSNVEGSDSIVAGRLPQERTCCKNVRCGSYTRIIALLIAKYIDETKKNSRANETILCLLECISRILCRACTGSCESFYSKPR